MPPRGSVGCDGRPTDRLHAGRIIHLTPRRVRQPPGPHSSPSSPTQKPILPRQVRLMDGKASMPVAHTFIDAHHLASRHIPSHHVTHLHGIRPYLNNSSIDSHAFQIPPFPSRLYHAMRTRAPASMRRREKKKWICVDKVYVQRSKSKRKYNKNATGPDAVPAPVTIFSPLRKDAVALRCRLARGEEVSVGRGNPSPEL